MWIVALALRRPYTFVVRSAFADSRSDRYLPDATDISEYQHSVVSICGTTRGTREMSTDRDLTERLTTTRTTSNTASPSR
jgi:hypothetical protein